MSEQEKLPDEVLSAYLDGELAQAQRASVERHLYSSPEAQQQLAELQKVSDCLKELPRSQPPHDFTQRVLELAEQRSLLPEPVAAPATVTAPARRAWLKPTLGIAAAAAAVVLMMQTVPPPAPDFVAVENNAPAQAESEPSTDQFELKVAQKSEQQPAQVAEPESLARNEEAASETNGATLVAEEAQDAKRVDKKILTDEIEKSLVELPHDLAWDRDSVGKVVEATVVDETRNKVTVFKAVVVNIDKWVGGTNVDITSLKGDSETIAVHVEATPQEFADLVSQINEEGSQLLNLEAGEPVILAQLTEKEQSYFRTTEGQAGETTPVQPNYTKTHNTRMRQEDHRAREVPAPSNRSVEADSASPAVPQDQPAEAEAERQRENTGAPGGVGGAEGSPAGPAQAEEKKSETEPELTQRLEYFVTAVPDSLREQLPQAPRVDQLPNRERGVKKPLARTSDRHAGRGAQIEELKLRIPIHQNGEVQQQEKSTQRIRYILLVHQGRPQPEQPQKPVEKSAGDGGGAA